MAFAIDQHLQQQPLSVDQFLARYGDDNRSELIDGEYDIQPLRGNERIISPTFPELKLTAEQVLRASR